MSARTAIRQISTVFAVVLLAIFGATFANAAKPKVALVIGNSVYEHAQTLPNPARDARLMARTFRNAGFQVIDAFDTSKAELNAVLDRFTEAAYDAETAIIYYAGHGVQVDGRNYLIPVDAELTSPAHLRTRAVELSHFTSAMPTDPGVGIVILDACRDNPLARTLASSSKTRSLSVGSGLAAVQAEQRGSGTGGILIAYATDPGAVALDGSGENSPYTMALAKHLTTPGLEVQSALTRVRGDVTKATRGMQRPWHNASIGREVFLGGKPEPVVNAGASGPRLQVGTPVVVKPEQPSADRRWAVEQRFWDEASKRNTAGHYRAYLDRFPAGRFAEMARLNIGLLEEEASGGDSATKTVAKPAEGKTEKPVQVAKANTDTATDARTDSAAKPTTVPSTKETEEALALNRDARRDVQMRLTALGHDTKGIDGAIGPNSRTAMAAWQEEQKLIPTGYLDAAQYAMLQTQSGPLMAAARAAYAAEQAAAARARQATKRKKTAALSRSTAKKKAPVKKRAKARAKPRKKAVPRRKTAKKRAPARRKAAPRRPSAQELAERRAWEERRRASRRGKSRGKPWPYGQKQRRGSAIGLIVGGAVVGGVVGCKLSKSC